MLDIQNFTSYKADKKSFTQVAKKVLSGENRGRETLSLVFVGKNEIQKINKALRKKNKPTDVLSLHLGEKECLGEIFICPDVVKEYAEKNGVAFSVEMRKTLIHGILHVLGYDHEISKKEEERMFLKQDYYLAKTAGSK